MTEDDNHELDPDRTGSETPRRTFLLAAGGLSMFGLAGCLGTGDAPTQEQPSRPSDWCVEENNVEVPEVYRTAESIDGIARTPDDLTGREDAAYQCHPQGYQLCANCRFFIPGKHAGGGDEGGAGACAIVEGLVRSQDWCALYQPTEDLAEFPHPDPLETDGQQKPPTRR